MITVTSDRLEILLLKFFSFPCGKLADLLDIRVTGITKFI